MKLLCHIGIAEAAAQLIQNTCANNALWLGARGMIYADVLAPTPNHVTLYFACAKELHRLARDYGLRSPDDLEAFRERLADHLDRQIEACGDDFHTMIMSSAALTGLMRQREEIARFRDLLLPRFDEVRILIYVRRQDDALMMKYNELIRRGQSRERFEDFVDGCLSAKNPMPHLDYRRALGPWLRLWGASRIVVRRFSATDFIRGDLIADVMGVLQNTWEPDLAGLEPAPDPGRFLSAPALEFLRCLHPSLPFAQDGKPNPRRQALMPAINAMPEAPPPIMPAAVSRQIMGHYRAANNWLKENFAPDLDGPFFPDRPDHPEHGNIGALTGVEAAEFAGKLLAAQNLRVA